MSREALDSVIAMLRARPANTDASWEAQRAEMEERQQGLEIPDDVVCEAVDADGVACEWVTCPGTEERTIVYLHGGGYTLGSITTHRYLMQSIARSARARVLAVDYRLAPEHPFPAAVDDAVAACAWLGAQGVPAHRTIVAGDSAGGGLALATLVALRDLEHDLPAGGVLLSPWTDLTGSGESMRSKADADPMVTADRLTEMAAAYAPGRTGDPLASPYFAELRGLPPLLVQVGTAEILLDDSTRLAERAKEAGILLDLEIWDEMIHVFQAFPMLEEADRAVGNIGSWIRQRT